MGKDRWPGGCGWGASEALARIGHAVAVVIPRYQGGEERSGEARDRRPADTAGRADLRSRDLGAQASGATFYFVDQPELFDRTGLYGDQRGDFPDNHIRFALLSKAALEVSRRLFAADVMHCHDWQASLVPAYLKDPRIADPHFLAIRTLLTIHNLGYQGIFDRSALGEIGLPRGVLLHRSGWSSSGHINFLKAGIVFADASEYRQPQVCGGDPDAGIWLRSGWAAAGAARCVERNSERRRLRPLESGDGSAHPGEVFGCRILAGKRNLQAELLREMGLPEKAQDRPLLGIISRFTGQKGFDLIAEAAPELFKDDIYLVALGNGEARWEDLFRDLQAEFPERVAVRFGYDDALAHRIEAGADIFLMPSRYEPCGLNQIYSLRYGTVPVVRATGGLDDTIVGAPARRGDGIQVP